MTKLSIATAIVKQLQESGHLAYFAGGWVRDLVMQHPSDDIDIATSASVEEIQALFPKTIPIGISFGIVIVVDRGHQFEVATFRKDRDYVDGRRPIGFDPATPQEDALRRDFTINGMFYDPLSETIYDFTEGKTDIANKTIRAIGDPAARFQEDRLRMMRAVRYATRFNFTIDTKTREAILDQAETLLPAVAMERIWQEFKKMAQFAHFDEGLAELQRLKLLPTIFPQLRGIPAADIEKRLAPVEYFPKGTPPIAELLQLFPRNSLEEWLGLCDYLKLSREDKEFAGKLHACFSMLQMPEDWQTNLEPIEWVRFYADERSHLYLKIFAAHLYVEEREEFYTTHASREKALWRFIERLRRNLPILSSQDLLLAGISPGPIMGKLLKEAERLAANFGIEDQEELLRLLRNSSLWPLSD
ncbi:MAG: CCA tRNA nucleotidyltransferase [Simkania sp.]|nr:CCA tRNA nucleotidyltransferase [Simkania sp.]